MPWNTRCFILCFPLDSMNPGLCIFFLILIFYVPFNKNLKCLTLSMWLKLCCAIRSKINVYMLVWDWEHTWSCRPKESLLWVWRETSEVFILIMLYLMFFCHSYIPGAWTEKGCDYDVPKTTCLILVGPRGSGKSSLINRISMALEDDKFAPVRAQVSCKIFSTLTLMSIWRLKM